MRASFHCAGISPCSAAYSSETRAFSLCPSFSRRVPERNASIGAIGAAGAANAGALGGGSVRLTGGGTIGLARGTAVSGISTGETPAAPCGIGAGGRGTSTDIARRGAGITVEEDGAGTTTTSGVPSKANPGVSPSPRPSATNAMMRSRVRIALLLGGSARMGHGAIDGGPDLLGVFPKIAGAVLRLARLPALAPFGELRRGEIDINRAVDGVDRDDVAIPQQRNRSAHGRFRPDMADAEATRRAREAPVGDQRDLAAGPLSSQRRSGREHLAHARTAARALVTDDEHVAFLVGAGLHGLEAGLFAVKAARRAGELERLQ